MEVETGRLRGGGHGKLTDQTSHGVLRCADIAHPVILQHRLSVLYSTLPYSINQEKSS